MKGIYGGEMLVARGKKHTYVGIYLNYSSPGKVIVSMDSYITEAIDEFPKDIMKTIKMLAGNHPFKVDESCVKYAKEIRSSFTGWGEVSLPDQARTSRHIANNRVPHNESDKSGQIL